MKDLTDELISESLGGIDRVEFIRNDTRAILEFTTPFPDCAKGLRKYTQEEIEVIINDPTIFIPCGGDEAKVKCQLLCMSDLDRLFTWQEINGVRRVVKIVFSSVAFNTQLGQTVTLERDFTYETADPFDMTRITDTLVVV
jgi:hypothetical protein